VAIFELLFWRPVFRLPSIMGLLQDNFVVTAHTSTPCSISALQHIYRSSTEGQVVEWWHGPLTSPLAKPPLVMIRQLSAWCISISIYTCSSHWRCSRRHLWHTHTHLWIKFLNKFCRISSEEFTTSYTVYVYQHVLHGGRKISNLKFSEGVKYTHNMQPLVNELINYTTFLLF